MKVGSFNDAVRSNPTLIFRYLDSSKVGENNMDMSLQKRSGSSTRGVLVGLGVLVCFALANLMLADVSSAAVPPTGLNCVASDGKISGRGASIQAHAETAFAEAYRDDFCGGTPNLPADPAGNTMAAYNYPAAEIGSGTGSGAGLKAASCRTDAYAGVSVPYTEAQWKELNETPGKEGPCNITFEPPFQPGPKPWPNASDIAANVMSLPVVGAAVTIDVNLTAANCEGTAPTSLSFTPKEASRIFGGTVATWNDSELVATNPSLAKCTVPVARVVRIDSAGMTEILKAYLVRVDNERAGQKCAEAKKWSAYQKTNTEWPGKQKPGEEGTCSSITTAATSGGPADVKKIEETEGGVGYNDLADAAGHAFIIANVQNATATSFQAPNAGKAANCTFSVLSLPGSSASDAVGLDPEDNYATNNEEVNKNPTHQNATDLGSKYPICGIVFDLVYTGLDNGAVANADSRLTADQRRTLYSYFSFVLSSTAQEKLGSIDYSPLPTSWLPTLREGFQTNF
jgi:ABC-type phosphate transport system substrate-binding protein